METDRIRPRKSCTNRMGSFGAIHGSGFSDVDSEILGLKNSLVFLCGAVSGPVRTRKCHYEFEIF
eukprot:COSAG05_NODE_380_length_10564_cov_116.331676_5_plen_65_part_00